MNNQNKKNDIMAGNIPQEFIINDPRTFITKMKSSFLKKVREISNLSLEQVASKCSISSEELNRIESGKITEQDMMVLHDLSEIYKLDYNNLLFIFKLVKSNKNKDYGVAAFHDPNIDLETRKNLEELIKYLKDAENE